MRCCPFRTVTLQVRSLDLAMVLPADQEAMLQEACWAGLQVALISLRQAGCNGTEPSRQRVPDGILHMQAQMSSLPAAMR